MRGMRTKIEEPACGKRGRKATTGKDHKLVMHKGTELRKHEEQGGPSHRAGRAGRAPGASAKGQWGGNTGTRGLPPEDQHLRSERREEATQDVKGQVRQDRAGPPGWGRSTRTEQTPAFREL